MFLFLEGGGYENILYSFCIRFVKKGWRCFCVFVCGGYEYYFMNMIHTSGYWLLVTGYWLLCKFV